MDRSPFLIKFVRIVVATMIQITSITFLSGMKYDNAFMLQIYIIYKPLYGYGDLTNILSVFHRYRRNSSAGVLPTLKDRSSPNQYRGRWQHGNNNSTSRTNWLSYSAYSRVPAPDESAIGNFFMTNLGRVTLGTLGISPYLDAGGRLTR